MQFTNDTRSDRRAILSVLVSPRDIESWTKERRLFAQESAAAIGDSIRGVYSYLGLPRLHLAAIDYVRCIIQPLYVAGYCGSGLIDTWTTRALAGELDNDPRVKAFLEGAQGTYL